jgi:predicted phage tail protein
MTKINIHGILAKKFGSIFNIEISNANSAIKAIDANRQNFIFEINNLHKKGFNYVMIVNGEMVKCKNEFLEKRKISTIDIVPYISGSGPAVAFIIPALIAAAVSLAVNFIMMALNKQAQPPQQFLSVGGSASSVDSAGKSYIFNNAQNIASQGDSIPVGYGRAKVSSHVISATIKNYPSNANYKNEFSNNSILISDIGSM